MAVLLFAGCDQLSSLGITRVEAKTADDRIDAFLTYQDALVGKDADAVREVFGKPNGIFEKQRGSIWTYARWRVEFDSQGRVVLLERDIATSEKGRLESVSMALASPPPTSDSIKRISNGGQPVDLNSLIVGGKITIVDFYADWCGPCRKIAPDLEALTENNPDVVLSKVDIVKWGTPVTRQYDIHSVPNIRVYDRSGKQVGESTSSLSAVQSYIEAAK